MPEADHTRNSPFPTTSWTLIRRVQEADETAAAAAMEEICRHYWYPIYAFARRQRFSPADAEDLTQVFFQRLIASETLHAAREEKGRLRNFMLSLLKKVISNHHRAASAEKRGGSRGATISIDTHEAEELYTHEPAEVRADAERLFERAWAEGVLLAAEEKLKAEFAEGDNLQDFATLREYLPLGHAPLPYPEAAAKLGLSEPSLRMQISRMRKRYAKLIKDEIAQTVRDPEEQAADLAELMAVMGR